MIFVKRLYRGYVDVIGWEFGRWTIIADPSGLTVRHRRVIVRCACGVEKSADLHMLAGGHSQSCGCLYREENKLRPITHGKSGTPLYRKWQGIIRRCFNKNTNRYHRYGGRGITVCDRWRDFKNFEADMGAGFKKGLTIERFDNNGNYEPSNCGWIPSVEQSRNRECCLFYGGESPDDAAKRIGLTAGAIRFRVRNGWSLKDAFTLPKGVRPSRRK